MLSLIHHLSAHLSKVCWFWTALLLGSCTPKAPDSPYHGNFRQAAEYEPTGAIWLQWPRQSPLQDQPLDSLYFQLLREISSQAPIRFIVPDSSFREHILLGCQHRGLATDKLSFFEIPYSEFWTRDMGPRFLTGPKGQLAMADFGFDTWSYLPPTDSLAQLDEKLDERVADVLGIPVRSSILVAEGGDQEINRHGILMLTESVQFRRNPNLTRSQIEAEYRRILGAKSFVWFRKGLRDDDFTLDGGIPDGKGDTLLTCLTTNGHVDEYARFADDTTVLIARGNQRASHPVERESARRMAENERILRRARTHKGKPFRIIPVPLPSPFTLEMEPGDGTYDILREMAFADGYRYGWGGRREKMIAASSYLNFLIVNDLVLVPAYGVPSDEEAMHAYRKAFPGKNIVTIHPLSLNWGGGGIHCITQNEPGIK